MCKVKSVEESQYTDRACLLLRFQVDMSTRTAAIAVKCLRSFLIDSSLMGLVGGWVKGSKSSYSNCMIFYIIPTQESVISACFV